MFTFLQGILIGLGKILPGVSGSLIAISMGLYDRLIKIISEFKIRENLLFLIKISLGIVVGIVLGSKLIYYLLNKHYLYTMSVIIGILLSSIIGILKIEKPNNKKDFLYILVSCLLIFIINGVSVKINHNYFTAVLLGFIDSLTMIIPGISGTAIYMILGVYEFVLSILSNINNYTVFFGIGLILGIYLTTKLVNYFLLKFHKEFYMVVLGFSISSLLVIIKLNSITFVSLVFIIFGFFFGLFFNHD